MSYSGGSLRKIIGLAGLTAGNVSDEAAAGLRTEDDDNIVQEAGNLMTQLDARVTAREAVNAIQQE